MGRPSDGRAENEDSRDANAVTRPLIEAVCRDNGFQPPVICTPEELVAQEAT
jgi:hypothetical protein